MKANEKNNFFDIVKQNDDYYILKVRSKETISEIHLERKNEEVSHYYKFTSLKLDSFHIDMKYILAANQIAYELFKPSLNYEKLFYELLNEMTREYPHGAMRILANYGLTLKQLAYMFNMHQEDVEEILL